MSLVGKLYNTPDGRQVQVLEEDTLFYTVSGGVKVKKDRFNESFSEVVSVDNFFKTPIVSDLAKQLENVDTSHLSDAVPPTQGYNTGGIAANQVLNNLNNQPPLPSNQVVNPGRQLTREEMIQEYNRKNPPIHPGQYPQMDDETAANTLLARNQQYLVGRQQPPQQPYNDPDIARFGGVEGEQQRPYYPEQQYQQQYQQPHIQTPEEKAYDFFAGIKKNHDVKIKVYFEEKIGDPEFLRLMANNYEADIIRFYTREIMNNVMRNPHKIEEMIYEHLSNLIYEGDKTPKELPHKPEKRISSLREKITEEVFFDENEDDDFEEIIDKKESPIEKPIKKIIKKTTKKNG